MAYVIKGARNKLGCMSIACALACGRAPLEKYHAATPQTVTIECIAAGVGLDCLAADAGNNKTLDTEPTSSTPAHDISYAWPACPANAHSPVLEEMGSSLSQPLAWRKEIHHNKQSILREIYRDGLTPENALKLALINNPDLFAYYENLSIAHADLLEASLRENPILTASTRLPNKAGYGVNKTYETMLNYTDFFLIPFRQQAALADIHVIEAEFGQKVLDLIKEVQINWLSLKTLDLRLNKEAERVYVKELAAQLSQLQRKAGNISVLKSRERQRAYDEAHVRLKNLEAELETAREAMNRSLGLLGNEGCWVVSGDLNEHNDAPFPNIHVMEQAAIENRLDLESIRREIYALAQEARLKDPWTYTNLKVGISSEKEADGLITTGPAIELEVPIFNNGQAERIKYHALIEQAQLRLLSKAIEACSEVREFSKTAEIYHEEAQVFQARILPELEKQIADAQAHYNVMTLGVYELFDLKEKQIETYLEYVIAVKHHIKARIDLLHALGGSFHHGIRSNP